MQKNCHNNRLRVRRRLLYSASFGQPTTIYGALVTLAAFLALWIVILRCVVENDPDHWIFNHLETGQFAIEQIAAYRDSNDGALPEGLENLGFRNTGYNNKYFIQLPKHGFGYEIQYIRLSDSTYFLGFGSGRWIKGEYLSEEGMWRVINQYSGDTSFCAGNS